jgi:hypothetical protein
MGFNQNRFPPRILKMPFKKLKIYYSSHTKELLIIEDDEPTLKAIK